MPDENGMENCNHKIAQKKTEYKYEYEYEYQIFKIRIIIFLGGSYNFQH